MGTFVFTWSQPASEVYVTGTFDDWKKTVKLDKQNGVFSRQVDLPAADKPILYKFVVDDKWTVDSTMPLESDDKGNVNNLLKPADISTIPAGGRSSHGQHPAPVAAGTLLSSVGPGASSVQRAANVPLEKGSAAAAAASEEMPGGASKSSGQTFSVAPLPATAGISNPVSVKPGEPLPPTGAYTSNTVASTVRTDKAAYENSDAYPASDTKALGTQGGAFGVPPVAGTMIPESSLPMHSTASAAAFADPGPFIQSSAADSSTAALAGQVPVEPRGSAEVVPNADSKEDDGILQTTAVAAGGALAGVAAIAAGVPASIQKAISDMSGSSAPAAQEPAEPAASVPDPVKSAQSAAHASPEASGNPEAVAEKAAVEGELMSKVPLATEAGEPAPAVSAAQSATAPQPQGGAATGVFSNDPTIADDSTAAAIAAMDTSSVPQPAALRGDPVKAGEGGVPASNGLNAPASQPAQSAATQVAQAKAVEKQEMLPGSAQRVDKDRADSRDVSPMSKPTITSGIEATTASASQGAPSAQDSAASSPATDKKAKRRSFFGKIKDKLKA